MNKDRQRVPKPPRSLNIATKQKNISGLGWLMIAVIMVLVVGPVWAADHHVGVEKMVAPLGSWGEKLMVMPIEGGRFLNRLFFQNPIAVLLGLGGVLAAMQRILGRSLLARIFAMQSGTQLAIAGLWGFMIGFLPLDGLRIITVIVSLLLVNLNLPALLLGLGLSLVVPLGCTGLINGLRAFSQTSLVSGVVANNGGASVSLLQKAGMNEPLYLLCLGGMLSCLGYYPAMAACGWLWRKLENRTGRKGRLLGLLLKILHSKLFFGGCSIAGALMIIKFSSEPLSGHYTYSGDLYPLLLLMAGQLSPEGFFLNVKKLTMLLLPFWILGLTAVNLYGGLRHFFRPINKVMGGQLRQQYVFNDRTGVRWLGVKKFSQAYLLIGLVVLVFGISCVFEGPMSIGHEKNAELNLPLRIKHQKAVYGFYVSWDYASKESLKRNIRRLDTVIPDWFRLNSNLGVFLRNDPEVDSLARKNRVQIIPLISNYVNHKWDQQLIHQLVVSEKGQRRFISTVVRELKRYNYDGVNVDFENINTGDRELFTRFIARLKKALRGAGLKLLLDIQVNSQSLDYTPLAAYADQLIVMLYDEHIDIGDPGPIASWGWFVESFRRLGVPPSKLVVGLANYGYDWVVGEKSPKAEVLSCDGVLSRARTYQGDFRWDPVLKSPYLVYHQADRRHIVWFNDSTVLYNQWQYALNQGVQGLALWRLGSEDRRIWGIVDRLDEPEQGVASLKTFGGESVAPQTGETETLLQDSSAKSVLRTLTLDRKGFIQKVRYQKPWRLQTGKPGAVKGPDQIALTFDDGPDPRVTPLILDILKRFRVKATFFMVGENIVQHPEILKRVYQEGHEIGNHTYSHLDFIQHTPQKVIQELYKTEQVIGSLIGQRTVYYRQPYNVDLIPQDAMNAGIFRLARQSGYTLVGSQIDPRDWDNPRPDEIVKRIAQQLGRGRIILLHDIGGRKNTIAALPAIIKRLQAKGYSFCTISGLQGKTPTPNVDLAAKDFHKLVRLKVATVISNGIKLIRNTLVGLMLFGTMAGILRFIMLIAFATLQKRNYNRMRVDVADFNPLVTVVVAAYNEEKVICKTVDSILQSDYAHLEVMVVNDGSTDGTAQVIHNTYAGHPRVKLVNKPNGGKASAVNVGFRAAAGEIVVVLDADTLLAGNAISLLARHFARENVAAVAGNVKVGNINNLITLWQHIEYVTGLNLERRAFDELNCITVVPGAIGAWRKEVVAEAGYYREDTLAEDADITISVLKRGYRIVYEEGAIAYTEAPEDLAGFLKQRLRWAYGTLQCLWKHKDTLFNPAHKTLGFLAMPNMWLYQFVFSTIAPVTDILFVVSMFGNHRLEMIGFYCFYFAIDFLVTYYAFSLEREKKRPLVWLFLQRIIYRRLITFVVYKSVMAALQGVKVGWNKLKRTGTASNQAPAG